MRHFLTSSYLLRTVFFTLFLPLLGCNSGNLKDNESLLTLGGYNPDYSLDPECFVSDREYVQHSAIDGVNLWQRIRDGYKLPEHQHSRIDMELRWYAKHPSYMARVGKRAERYMFHIVSEIEARDMPLEIALLPIVESAFDPFAYSHGRASGIWQIIPGTGKMLGLKQNWWYDGRRDIVASTDAALRYLKGLNKQFKGDWMLALAAYNSGAGNVRKAIRKNKKRGKPTDFWHLDLPKETKAYVPRLLALSKLIGEPEKYNLALTPIFNKPHFKSVAVGSQIDLAQAAELAEIKMDVLYHLNPAFNRWATDPRGPHKLLVPVEKADEFKEKLAGIPNNQRVTWERYTIKNGDTLSTIAQKYKVSVPSLKSVNSINGNNIRAGKTLMVPVAAKSDGHYSYSVEERISKRYANVDKKERGQRIDYLVQPGDSFWSIGRNYKVSTKKLAKWNSMAPRDPIKPGQVLKIWTKSPQAPGSKGVIRKVSYKVRSGDSLARIAQKFSLKINDIVKWNQINQKKYLQPGQKLTLFVDVTRG
ncbi:MAG: LysM peptidoglycan-binding domain-containing protein [Agarilytica sp.]